MKKLGLLAGLLVFLVSIWACSSGTSSKGSGSPKVELTEQEKNEKDVALRNETEARMMKGEYLHDGSLTLESVGDVESVPALLVVLQEYPPDKNGVMACPAAHALSALEKITGANPGTTHKAWSDWWKRYKKENKIVGRIPEDKSSK